MVHAGIATLTAVFVVVVLAGRWWNTPVRSTSPYVDGHPTVETPLIELMGDWPEPATGAVVAQAWRWCADCMRMEPSLLHADDCWRCGHCLAVTYAGSAA
jgi:hypothetical protein